MNTKLLGSLFIAFVLIGCAVRKPLEIVDPRPKTVNEKFFDSAAEKIPEWEEENEKHNGFLRAALRQVERDFQDCYRKYGSAGFDEAVNKLRADWATLRLTDEQFHSLTFI